MNHNYRLIKQIGAVSAGILCVLWLVPAGAQVPVDDNGNPLAPIGVVEDYDGGAGDDQSLQRLSVKELEQLVGPVALYPDNLLAIVLPAASYPLEIVQAARFLADFRNDSALQPDEDWNEAVTALLNYPEVLEMMNENLDWTWRLGDAVLSQQTDVIAAVESFRDQAYEAGNLKSDKHQNVRNDGDYIEIEPVEEEVIYVPYYEPERVVVRQVEPVYYYYPRAYPVYYYPYPVGHRWSHGFFWGVTTAFGIGWSSHNLHVHHHSYRSHPYYGHHYYGHHYRRPSLTIHNLWYVGNGRRAAAHRHYQGDVWRPRHRSGARPGDHHTRTRRVVTRDHHADSSRTLTSGYAVSPRGERRDERQRDEQTTTRRDNNRLQTTDTRRGGEHRDRSTGQVTTRVYSDRTTPSLRASATRAQRERVKDAGPVDTTGQPATIRFRDRSATSTAQRTDNTRQRGSRGDVAERIDTIAQPSTIRFRDRTTTSTAQRSDTRRSKEDIHSASRTQSTTTRVATHTRQRTPERATTVARTTGTTAFQRSRSSERERAGMVPAPAPKTATRETQTRHRTTTTTRTVAAKPRTETPATASRQRDTTRVEQPAAAPRRDSNNRDQKRESRTRSTRSDADDRKTRRR